MTGLVILVLLFQLTKSQNFQPLCREFCSDGEFAGIENTTERPNPPKCQGDPIPLLSAERFNISGLLTCRNLPGGPKNASIILFNQCDKNLYREIGRTNSLFSNGNYHYELAVSNKITDANLYLLINHTCYPKDSKSKHRESVIDLRKTARNECRDVCKRQCDGFKGIKFCDCKNNSSRKNHTGLNCTAICQSSKFWTDNSDNNFVKSYSGFI